jgi:hypothetical protein
MPLTKSPTRAAFRKNVAEMIRAGHPRAQALAAAYDTARRAGGHFAGGGTPQASWLERGAARAVQHEGMLNSAVPGRSDQLPIGVPAGAYVLPADHVSHLGQNNSQAGAEVLNRMFKLGPYGSGLGPIKAGKLHAQNTNLKPDAPRMPVFRAAGGQAGNVNNNVNIVTAGGEFILPPHVVAELGGGDINYGHKLLDAWVNETRKQHIATLRGLKPPRKGGRPPPQLPARQPTPRPRKYVSGGLVVI